MGVRLPLGLLLCGLALGLAQKDTSQYQRYVRDTVRRPPDILPSGLPVHILYESDMDVVLPCVATGFPFPTYEWLRDGEILDPNTRNIRTSPDPSDGTLTISPITSMDEGYYQCRARSVHGTSVSSVYFLERARFGRFPVTEIRNYTVKEGDPLKLECIDVPSIPKASFSWALVQTTIDQSPVSLVTNRRVTRDANGNLYFSYTNRGDAQITTEDPERPSLLYKCNVFNSHLDFSVGGSYSRIIVEAPDGVLADKPPSLLHATQSPYLAIKGGEIRIQCIFAGRPGVEVTWEPMPGGRSTTDEHGTVLVIENVEFADQGVYTCRGRNNAGDMHESIMVDVQSKPVFEAQPLNMNATEQDTVSVECRVLEDTEPPASVEWFINGEPLQLSSPGPRTEVSDGGKRLTISRLCKDCVGGSSDLKVIQCNASNVHGYVFSDGYLNVLLKTVIFTPPEDQYMDADDTFAVFRCEARSDASTPVLITWEFEDHSLDFYADERFINNGSSLIINVDGLEMKDKKKYEGTYSCFATNHYSSQGAIAKLYIDDGIVVPPPWWVWLMLALLLLILLILLIICCCCCCYRRNRGGVYPVDQKEREMGNDPEKECVATGFHDYRRPEIQTLKGSRASLASTGQLDIDEEGSLAEYGLYNTQPRR